MEDNSCQSVVSAPADAGWRPEFTTDVRQRIVNKLFESVKCQFRYTDPSTLNQLNCVTLQFEENLFSNAASKDDYMKGITKRMMQADNAYRQTISTSSTNPGVSQTSGVHGFPDDFVSSSIGQGMSSNGFTNTQRDMSGTQPSQQIYQPSQQQQQLQYQLLNHNVTQQNGRPSHMQQNIHYYHQQGQPQPQQMISKPNQLQHSQQQMLLAQPQQQLLAQQLNYTLFQRNQHFAQQNNMTEQQKWLLCQQNMSNSAQQPMSPQSNISGMQQVHPQNMAEKQSNDQSLQSQHLQQADAKASQQNLLQTSQPFQLHPLLGSHNQNNSTQEGMQQRLQMSATGMQPQSVEQKRTIQSQRSLPETPSASVESSVATTEPSSVGDWHDQAYAELQSVKEKLLPDLKIFWEMTCTMCSRSQEPEIVEKYKNSIMLMEKMMKFLQMTRNEISHCSKEKLDHYKMQIIKYVSANKNKHLASLQQRGQQVQSPGGQSQVYQLQQHRNLKLQSQVLNMPASVGSSPLSPTQQGGPNSPSNIMGSIQPCTRTGLEQRNVPSPLQHGTARSIHHSILGTLQQTNFPHNVNVPSLNSLHQGSTIPYLQQKQQEKHQMMSVQNLKQQVQPQWYQQKRQQMLKQNVPLGVNSMMLQEHQRADFLHQTFMQNSTRQVHATSPQASQQSSPQIDQHNNLSPLSRIGTPMQSANSPFIMPSPNTPLTPSSVSIDLEKQASSFATVAASENSVHPQTPASLAPSQTKVQNRSLSIDKHRISASPLLTESTNPEGNSQSGASKQPFQRLLKAVESISSNAMAASVHEIGCLINLADTIAERTSDRVCSSTGGEDLVSQAWFHLKGSTLCTPSSENMKRHISALTLNTSSNSITDNDSLKHFIGLDDIDSATISWPKRCRIELQPNGKLLDEIKCINQQLVETVIDFDMTEDKGGRGTIVKFSYSGLILNEKLKLQYSASQMLPILPLRLLVPENYPDSPPKILDALPVDMSSENSEDLLEKAKGRFSRALRTLTEPVSVGEMARSWDSCARAALAEHAQLMGGECFSSRYGSWESCVTAS